MKKKWINGTWYAMSGLKKMLMIMRLIVFFVLFSVMSTLASSVFSQKTQVKITVKKGSLESVLKQVRDKSDYTFFYYQEDIKGVEVHNININSKSIKEVMDKVLKGTGMKYMVEDMVVIITPKKVKKPEKKDVLMKGKVVDKKGNPLPGVSVVIKGTITGTATDSKGEFQIKGKKGDILKFTFIGMKNKEVKYEGKYLTIKMLEDVQTLDEIIIDSGYEKIDKRKLTCAVSVVKGKDIIQPMPVSLDQMLEGRVPGLIVMNQSSTPGACAKIRSRGSASISGNREPLWVLNGIILTDPVRLDVSELNSMDKVNLIGNAISSINPQDIEDITFLKDAAATALYGSKAANGVIVIKTKQGKKGKPSISFSNSCSIITKPDFDKMYRMNAYERLDLSMEMHKKGLYFRSYSPSYVGYEKVLDDLWKRNISYEEYQKQVDYLSGQSTDWYDILFRNSLSTNHNVSISGGSESTSYYFSLGYGKNNGTAKGESQKRYNINCSINTSFSKKVRAGFNVSASNSDTERPNPSVDPYKYAYETSPLLPCYNADGSLFFYTMKNSYSSNCPQYPLQYNILHELEHGGSSNTMTTMNLSSYLDWDIAKWLHFNTTFGCAVSNTNLETWADERSYEVTELRKYPYGKPLPTERYFGVSNCEIPYGGYLKNNDTRNKNYTFRFSLNANKSFGDHHLSASVGYEMNSSEYRGISTKEYGYLPDRGRKFVSITDLERWERYFQVIERQENKDQSTSSISNFMSYYSSFTYSLKNKYVFNANMRADASNMFGQSEDAKFQPIWSFSFRWNIYKEGIFDNIDWLNSLSARFSYGTQGNVSMEHSPYLICSRGTLDDMSEEYSSKLDRLPNPGLRWEKTKSYNLGIDFSLFNNFLSGNVDLYKRKGEDQVISKAVPSTNGVETVTMNAGTIENKGWDLSFSCNPINTKNWGLGISINTGKVYNKVTNSGLNSYSYTNFLDGSVIIDGQPVSTFYSYKFNGLNDTGEPTFDLTERDKENNPIKYENIQEKCLDIMVSSGQKEPNLQGGLSTNLRYKNFRINMLFSFSLGGKERLNDLYTSKNQNFPYPQQNASSELVNRWRNPGDEEFTNIPALSSRDISGYQKFTDRYGNTYWPTSPYIVDSYWSMYNNSDIRVFSKDYLKCRSLSLSYNFSKDMCQKLNIKGMTLSASANNIFTIKNKELKGRDPEQIKLGEGAIPPQRTYSFSLTFNF